MRGAANNRGMFPRIPELPVHSWTGTKAASRNGETEGQKAARVIYIVGVVQTRVRGMYARARVCLSMWMCALTPMKD